jgi:hypothetical protein
MDSQQETSNIAHEFTMNFRVKDILYFASFNGGKRQEWTRAIKTKGGVSPRSMQRYTQHASGLVETSEERRAYSCACAHECATEFRIDLAHTLI